MTQTTKPDKVAIREWLDRRTHDEDPPPTPDEVREQLGWRMIPENGTAREDND